MQQNRETLECASTQESEQTTLPLLKNLRALDWLTLAAELVLVFVGITAALWFDNWNADRADRALEERILSEIRAGLIADTSDLNKNLRNSQGTLASIDTVLVSLDQGRPYRPELDYHFGRATQFTNFIRNTAAYEQLKSAGLQIVTDDDLRRGITRYFEFEGELLHQSETFFVNDHFARILAPIMADRFQYRGFLEPASPNNYEALRMDQAFRSALTTHRGWIEWKDNNGRAVRALAEALIARIGEG